MKNMLSAIFLLLLISIPLYSSNQHVSFMLEFDQMLSFRGGIEFVSSRNWGLKTSVGFPGFSFRSLTANLLFFYRISRPESLWSFDLEAGVPIAYAKFNEDECDEGEPGIASPFAGWIAGLTLMTRYKPWRLGLRMGAGVWWEWQEYNGMKGPRIMPIVALTYVFSIKSRRDA